MQMKLNFQFKRLIMANDFRWRLSLIAILVRMLQKILCGSRGEYCAHFCAQIPFRPKQHIFVIQSSGHYDQTDGGKKKLDARTGCATAII